MSKGYHPLSTKRSDAVLITAALVGAGGTDDLVVSEAANGHVLAAVYSATGVYTITFRDSYPALLAILGCEVVGTTDGLRGQFSAIDVAAKTATLEIYVGSTKTVLATTDTMYIAILVRNSGAN